MLAVRTLSDLHVLRSFPNRRIDNEQGIACFRCLRCDKCWKRLPLDVHVPSGALSGASAWCLLSAAATFRILLRRLRLFFLAKHKTKCAGRLRAAESQFIYSLAFDMIFTRESAARLINNAPRDIRRAALELDVNRARWLLAGRVSSKSHVGDAHSTKSDETHTHTRTKPSWWL